MLPAAVAACASRAGMRSLVAVKREKGTATEEEGGWYPRAIKILRLCKFHVVETQRKINRGSSSAFSLSRVPSIHRASPVYACMYIYIYNTARFRILPSACVRKKYRRDKSEIKVCAFARFLLAL